MGTGGPGGIVGDELAFLEIPQRAGLFGTPSPTANADHLVEALPIREGVVSSMDDDEPSAIFDEQVQLLAEIERPIRSVVIEDDGLIAAEVRLEVGEVLAKTGRCSDRDAE